MTDRSGFPDLKGALCAKADPTDDPWHPDERGNSKRLRQKTEYAKQICAECPKLEPCRDWAVSHPDEIGIWGGLTERERIQIRTSGKITPRQEIEHGTEPGYDAERRQGLKTCAACRKASAEARQKRLARRREQAA